jgi:hypothetical protein
MYDSGRLERLAWSDWYARRCDVNPQLEQSFICMEVWNKCNSSSAQKPRSSFHETRDLMMSDPTTTPLPHEQRCHKPNATDSRDRAQHDTPMQSEPGQAARKSVEMVDSNTCSK